MALHNSAMNWGKQERILEVVQSSRFLCNAKFFTKRGKG
ncbi:hypothetical protein COO91_05752 [Nostoc flagelliforme CCNUN1]|uniref:Uncharacterized protein n=1 Tax=Nostoc flagelliforme CCNUN1 TaxID=2038116 RepID=A0A2K8SWE0_9NOSO|nr:hypothetical protein COO91_05752 [Nostoc flagelliforme CCNUN1]